MRRIRILVGFLSVVLLLGGCAIWRLQSPSVTIANLRVIEANLLEQRFAFRLRIQNPNSRDIAVKGLTFEITINDETFAKGISGQPVLLKAMNETLVDVNAVSDFTAILRQIRAIRKSGGNAVSYRITGSLHTESPFELRFENSSFITLPLPDEK